VQQNLGPIPLSSVVERTTINVAHLPSFSRSSVESTINANDLNQAKAIVERLANASGE
jgi:protein phosphatase